MHRFFIHKISPEALVIKDLEQVHQIRDVLKLHAGEQVVLLPGDGTELVCEIISIGKKDISLGLIERRNAAPEPARMVTLYCAVLKRDNFEWVIQKATECGVARIVPLHTDHTVKLGLNEDRLQKIIVEAAEQSGRGVLPYLAPIMTFREALQSIDGTSIFFEQAETVFSSADVRAAKKINLFIGPEGGWSEHEKNAALEAGLLVRSLGPRVLRAETAAIVATFNAVQF